MTAEIAIINKTAVALAADSKVTLSAGGKLKTYDTVDKIFSLSKSEPVGAMIYGSADFMGFPWETILKQYRRQKPQKKFATIFAWADDIRKYLVEFFPFSATDDEVFVTRVARTAIEQIVDRYFEFLQTGMTQNDIEVGLAEEIDQHIANLVDAEDFLSELEWTQMSSRIDPILDEMSKNGYLNTFQSIPSKLKTFAELSIKKRVVSPSHSGLVITGFGDSEWLPSIVAYEIDGVLNSKLKYVEHSKFDATRQNHGMIHPFEKHNLGPLPA